MVNYRVWLNAMLSTDYFAFIAWEKPLDDLNLAKLTSLCASRVKISMSYLFFLDNPKELSCSDFFSDETLTNQCFSC